MAEEIFTPVSINYEVYKKILPIYLAEIKSELIEMENYFSKSNFLQVKAIAHKIKGSSISYGAQLVYQKSTEIESNISNNDTSNLKTDIPLLRKVIEQTILEASRKFGV